MRRLALSLGAIAVGSAATLARAQDGLRPLRQFLHGYEETPSAVSTTGNGTFNARISSDGSHIDWEKLRDFMLVTPGTTTSAMNSDTVNGNCAWRTRP